MKQKIKQLILTSFAFGIIFSNFTYSSSIENNNLNTLNILTKQELINKNIKGEVSSVDAKEILKDYDFETETIDIKDLPKDATVLKFDSKEDMEQYFANAEKSFNTQERIASAYSDRIIDNNTKALRNGETRSISTIQRKVSKKYGMTSCNLIANINVYSSGSFRSITGCSQYTNISGFTLGHSWKQQYSSNNLKRESTNITVQGSGQLITYLLTEATKIEVARRNVNLSLYYSVY